MREDWIECELGEICFTTSGGTPSRNKIEFYQGSIPWVKSGELDKGVIYDTEEHISEDAIINSSAKIFPEGTLLIALYGATIGKLAFLGVEAATNQAICGIFKSSAIEPKYLFNFLLNRRQKLISQGTGGAQPNISQTILKNLSVPLAPLPIQRAIVSKIEALFSDLDNGIANLKKAQEQLKVYRQAVLKKAFEGGFSITNEEFRITNSENHSSDNLPKGWKWVKLGEVALKIGSGSTPKGGQENYKTEGIPLIRSMNIYFEYIKYEGLAFIDENQAKKLNNVIVYENDILLNITGASIGRVNLAPKQFNNARVNQHVSIIRLNDSDFNPKFIKYFIQSPKIQDWINSENYGATRQALSKNMIENIVVPKLKLQEQTQIVQEIESRLSVTDNLEIVIRNSIEKAEALRQSILKKAFEGKLLSEAEIEQCKAAADYEPASKLLKKIQAEKLAKEQEKKKKPTVKKKIPKG